MSDYIVTDTELTETANAIRAKTGDANLVEWESGTGFAAAVAAISSGGGFVVPDVPEGYTKLAYIEGTGSQYLALPYAPNINTEVEIVSQRTSRQQYSASNFGTASPSVQMSGGYFAFGNAVDRTGLFDLDSCGMYHIIFNKDYIYGVLNQDIRQSIVRIGGTSVSPGGQIFGVMCRFSGTKAERIEKSRLFYCRIFEQWETFFELVPVMRNSDYTLGAYDVQNDVFRGNAGTGEFVGGTL